MIPDSVLREIIAGTHGYNPQADLARALLEARAAIPRLAEAAYERGLCAGEHRAFLTSKDHAVHVRAALRDSGAAACLPESE